MTFLGPSGPEDHIAKANATINAKIAIGEDTAAARGTVSVQMTPAQIRCSGAADVPPLPVSRTLDFGVREVKARACVGTSPTQCRYAQIARLTKKHQDSL